MADEGFRRKLTAILSADVEGYSRLMGEDEDATIRTLTAYRELMSALIKKHRGRVVDSPGDNLLAEFLSVVDAVRCAVETQEELRVRNAELPENRRMEFRIGVNLGDVVEEGERIYGDGVNITARVEGLAEGGGICISGTVYDSIKNKLSLGYESMGEHTVKNIKEPVRVYRMRIGPEAVTPVVRKEKAGPRRWQKAALPAIAVLIVVAGALAIWNFYFRPPTIDPASVENMAYPLPDRQSIAVLPFLNLSEDKEKEYFVDGITSNIISALYEFKNLFVIASSTTFSYKGKPVKVQEVSEELGVRYILEGSVQRTSDQMRINAQLVDATSGRQLWAERYDLEVQHLFEIQDEIVEMIVASLAFKVDATERANVMRKAPGNLDAYDYWLRGRHIWFGFTKEANAKARELYEKAIELDPGWGRPYGYMAWVHVNDARFGWSENPKKTMELALKTALKAYELNPDDYETHWTLGLVYLYLKDYDRALAGYERALALNSNDADFLAEMSLALIYLGQPEKSIAQIKKAMRMNPRHPSWHWEVLGQAYYEVGRYQDALVALKANNSPFFSNYRTLAAVYVRLDRPDEARAAISEMFKINEHYTLQTEQSQPYKVAAQRDRLVNDLREAGVPEHPPLQLPDKPSIAVLAFDNLSGDPEQEYFSDGIAENIITALSKVDELFVIARNSSFTYKGKPVKVQQISRELGVRYVLEGSVQKSGNRVRINAQLIDAKNGQHLWAEKYDRDLKEIFALQDEITIKIISALQVKLTEGEIARITAKGTQNLEAYLKVLQARKSFFTVTKEGMAITRHLCEQALSHDPEYAAAYGFIGSTHWMDFLLGSSRSPKESLKLAFKFLEKAKALNDSLAVSQLGYLYIIKRQYDKGIAECERAVALEPNSGRAHIWMSLVLRHVGRHEEAVGYAERALRLDPLAPGWYFRQLGQAYSWIGRYEEAIAALNKSLQRAPNDIFTHLSLTTTYTWADRQDEARSQAAEVLRINPKYTIANAERASPYKNKLDLERYKDGLRKAGLPE